MVVLVMTPLWTPLQFQARTVAMAVMAAPAEREAMAEPVAMEVLEL